MPMSDPTSVLSSSGDYQINLTTESAQRFREALRGFLGETGCSMAAIIERSGAVLASEQNAPAGGKRIPRADSLGVLAAGLFASTQMMAEQIGEEGAPEVLCHGRELHTFVAPLTQEFALLAVFPDRVAVGLVRLQGKRLGATVGPELRRVIRNVTTLAPSSGSPGEERVESPFLRYN